MGNNSGPFDRKVELLDKIADLLTGTDDLENPTGNRLNDSLQRIAEAIENGDIDIGGGGNTDPSGDNPSAPSSYAEMEDAPVKTNVTTIETDTTAPSFTFGGKTYYRVVDHMLTRDELVGAVVNGTDVITTDRVNDFTYTTKNTFGVEVPFVAVYFDRTADQVTGMPYFPIVSIGGAIAAVGADVGLWVSEDISSLEFRTVTEGEGYENLTLPQYAENNFVGQTLQMDKTGKFAPGAAMPIQGMTSWREIKRNVKLGRGSTLYPIHSILNVRSKKYGSIPFEVVAHDVDKDPDDANAHTMTLHCLDALMRQGIRGFEFDATEKLCTCPSGLTAGAYSFGSGMASFTLTQNVPANGYIVIDYDWINDRYNGVKSYASDGTAVETVAIEFDNPDANATELSTVLDSSDLNDSFRAQYGSGNYGQSGIRQWLNGRGKNWWSAATKFDMPPSYVGDDGFLGDLDDDFVKVLLATEQTVQTNDVYEIGDGMSTSSTYTVSDKIFLPCFDQVFAGGNSTEGTLWDAFDFTNSNLSDVEQALARVKYDHAYGGETPCWWWLRSPVSRDTHFVRNVNLSGFSDFDHARRPWGAVAPACVI